MKILLLNDNPVVNKLVTLSAQKTSDELDVVANIEDIADTSYDLVVVDDSVGGDALLDELKKKVAFSKSLYICARDTEEAVEFDSALKKPFLPTDLVELFAMFDKEVEQGVVAPSSQSVEEEFEEDIESEENVDEIANQEELDEFEEVALDEQVDLDMEELELDLEGSDDALTLDEEEIDLDGEELQLDEMDEALINEDSLDDEQLNESVLDDEEAQKVKDLLDETEDETFHFDPHVASKELGLPLDVIEEFVSDFIEQASEYKEKFYAAAVEEDYDTVHEIAHKLKGVATNLRIEDAFDTLVVINESSDKEEIQKNLDKFYAIVEQMPEAAIQEDDAVQEEEAVDFDMALDLEDEADADIGDDDTLNELDELSLEEDEEELQLDDVENDTVDEIEDIIDEEVTEELQEQSGEEELLEDEEVDVDISEDEELLALDEDLEDIEEMSEEALEELAEEELESDVEESEEVEKEEDIADIEQQIQEAVEELSEEDLESELDDETLLEIAASEIDSLDKLSSKELKLALGEELDEEELESEEEVSSEDVEELLEEAEEEVQASEEDTEEKIEGVEALKKLLKALDDKDVAASMKGMKITINIELGNSNE